MGLNESARTRIRRAGARFEVDLSGELTTWGVDSRADVTLIVAQPTDALKETSLGTVAAALDRDEVWEVAGLSVAPQVVDSKPEGVATVADWLEHLRSSGVEIEVSERSGGRATPST